ncbi:MAG: hypothetical protein ACOYMD_04845 [Paludibacter sp.]
METIFIVLIFIIVLIYIATNLQKNNFGRPESSEKILLINTYREALKAGDRVLALDAFIDLFNELMKMKDIAYLKKVNIAKDYAKELIALKSDDSINDLILKMNLSKEKSLILTQIKELGILTDEEIILTKSEVTNESKFVPKKKPIRKIQS